MLRVGIDVGGTNTDAVLLDGDRVVATVKTAGTDDLTTGITRALDTVLHKAGAAPEQVAAVMIGTTHFINAILERKDLAPAAAIRLGLPSGDALPPMVDWPDDLREAVGGAAFMVHGGREFDGRPLSPVDPDEIRRVARRIGELGIRSIAVSSVFAPVQAQDEQRAAAIVREVLPDADITLSSEIGRMGLLERENAGILNACLRPLAARTVRAFLRALEGRGIGGRLYLTQNDGTLMNAAFAERYPVLTFASGPTNSMRGAAFLSGVRSGIVVDIGGTSTDVGTLIQGFPREASAAVAVGGVRTNFRMPDVWSIALGGGTMVRTDPLAIGPQSVGRRIVREALVFGGQTLTATDVTVAAGCARVGDPDRVRHLPPVLVEAVVDRMHRLVEEAVDRMKTAAGDVPVVLVGGGSILVGRPLRGAARVIKPDHYEVANAVGAAIAQVSGTVDRIYNLDGVDRGEALRQAREEAVHRAVEAGARRDTVAIVDVEDVPLAYLPSNATRIRVKAVGELALAGERRGPAGQPSSGA
ncbi:MAG TPA: hydantoinase/oxoprolinase family protein [Bacillota bacterium]